MRRMVLIKYCGICFEGQGSEVVASVSLPPIMVDGVLVDVDVCSDHASEPRSLTEVEKIAREYGTPHEVVAKKSTRRKAVSAAVMTPPVASADEITCPECGKPAQNKVGLGVHREHAHGVAGAARQRKAALNGGLRCPECGDPAKNASGMGSHRRNKHGVVGQSSRTRYRSAGTRT